MLRLYAAGSNARGQLGSGHCEDQHTFEPAKFAYEIEGEEQTSADFPPGASNILNIVCGANHTLVLFNSYEIWASGDSSRGQLGSRPSTTVFRKLSFDLASYGVDEGLFPIDVAATWETSYVVFGGGNDLGKLSDVVLSFGADDFGDRGVGPSPPPEPSVIDFQQAVPGNPWRIKVRELTAGQHHVLGRLEVWGAEGSKSYMVVVGWGASRHGQLGGLPPTTRKSSKVYSRLAGQAAVKFDKPRAILSYPGEARPIQLAAGAQHSLILHTTHRVTPLGSSYHGQIDLRQDLLEPATTPNAVRAIGCTWSTSFFVTNGSLESIALWEIESYGKSNHGQLGRLSPSIFPFGVLFGTSIYSSGFLNLACGSEHALLLTERGVWGWGWNEHGNLGLGHTEDVEWPLALYPATKGTHTLQEEPEKVALGIWAGCGTSWILFRDNGAAQETEQSGADLDL